MTPTLDLSNLTPEQLQAFSQIVNQQMLMTQKRPEPVDANKIENPNLGKRIPYPKMIYNHETRQTLIVKDAEEHQAAAQQGYVTEPFVEEDSKPAVKGPGFEEESSELAEMRELLVQQQEQIQALMAKKPMNRRSGE